MHSLTDKMETETAENETYDPRKGNQQWVLELAYSKGGNVPDIQVKKCSGVFSVWQINYCSNNGPIKWKFGV